MRHNTQIRGVQTVRVISDNGENLGTFPFAEALKMAQDQGLDLVEMDKQNSICKIMDFGRWQYNQKKNKKPQVVIETKEVSITVGTADHDMNIKKDHVIEWLKQGHRILVKLKFSGRQITHPKLGFEKIESFMDLIPTELFVLESKPSLSGKMISLQVRSTFQPGS